MWLLTTPYALKMISSEAIKSQALTRLLTFDVILAFCGINTFLELKKKEEINGTTNKHEF